MDRWPINPKRVAVFIGILILVLMVMDFNARLEDLKRLQKQAGVVSVQVTQVAQTQLALQTQVAYAGSDQAVQEWKETVATKTSVETLAKPVLNWANSHPKDIQVPEALHYVVRAYRYGCDEPSLNYSRIAFKLLHQRYPGSEWARRTPSWF